MIDRIQPQALEFEVVVIGAIMQSGECYEMVSGILKPEMFYDRRYKLVYKAINRLHAKKMPIDVLTVVKELSNVGELEDAGGMLFVHGLMKNVGGYANIEAHSRLIQEKYIKREAIKAASAIIDQAFNETYDVFEIQTNVRNLDCFFSDQTTGGNQFTPIEKLLREERDRYDQRVAAKAAGTPQGIPTGLRVLNNITRGWQKGNLIIVAARPAMGKTALMLCLARGAAQAGFPVYIPTLEMTPDELTERFVVMESEVNSEGYKTGTLSVPEMLQTDSARDVIRKMGIYIDDTPAITATKLKALCRKFCKEHPNGIVMVDYLQKMKVENERGKNREQVINEISQELKNIARENKIPVIALSQLSREVEKRSDKRPMLSDLRESGAIEQEADVVIFLHRPEYYDTNDTSGLAELIIAKYRNGGTGIANAKFIPELIKFVDVDEMPYAPKPLTPNTNFHETKKQTDIEEPF